MYATDYNYFYIFKKTQPNFDNNFPNLFNDFQSVFYPLLDSDSTIYNIVKTFDEKYLYLSS
jgi:hypothetical protein